MEQIAFRMQLKAGNTAEYKRRHDAIWPELVALLTETGIRDYSIFLDESTGALFATLRRIEMHRMPDLPEHAVMRRWWTHMADLMETDATLAPLSVPLIPMFHCD
ncbi:L-rhamnose mutarotase [Glaciimonas sp. PAMC28666]|uniref:L-rhamnose mutarotase n=1 Tax=Glaciimonas sp. PAMC28666 TaxID=2807626 RepID=UPI0019648E8F|nr:L-rhamnose mutarotase [Glaciimonas sp. PAMC28666]QRX82601.1 L-rhamnose mutarotase [Glaciimonas sp. PAMC28666]